MTDGHESASPSQEALPRPGRPIGPELDQSQLRLHRLLLLLGMAPARAYEDACRIASGVLGLATASHLLFHLAREIDGHIRQVCETLVPDERQRRRRWMIWRKDDDADEGARSSVKRAARGLGFNESDELIADWYYLVGKRFAKYAHRGDLGGPRPIDDELVRTWEETQRVWSIVLDRFEGRIAAFYPTLDGLIDLDTPRRKDLRVLRQRVPNNDVTLGYFFDRLDKPGWLPQLRKSRMFAHPPPVVPDASGLKAPRWPQVSYLERMAVREPTQVVEILRELPLIDNPTVLEQLTAVVISLPAKDAVRLIDVLPKWLATPYNKTLVTMRFTELVKRLIANGYTAEAIQLSQALLQIRAGSD